MEQLTIVEKSLIVVALEAWVEETNTPFLESKKKTIYQKLGLETNTPEPKDIFKPEEGAVIRIHPSPPKYDKNVYSLIQAQNAEIDREIYLRRLLQDKLIKHPYFENNIMDLNQEEIQKLNIPYTVDGASRISVLLDTGLSKRKNNNKLANVVERIVKELVNGLRVILLWSPEKIQVVYQNPEQALEYDDGVFKYKGWDLDMVADIPLFISKESRTKR